MPTTMQAVVKAHAAPGIELREVPIPTPGPGEVLVRVQAASVCGIDQLWEIVGASALELVASQLYTNTCGLPAHPVTQLVEGIWFEGRTLALPPQGSAETGPARRLRMGAGTPA